MSLSPRLMSQIVFARHADDLLAAAQAAAQVDDREISLQIAHRAAALTPEAAWPYRLLAMLAPDAAAFALERRLRRLEPDNPEVLWRLARRLAFQPDAEPGRGESERQRLHDPGDASEGPGDASEGPGDASEGYVRALAGIFAGAEADEGVRDLARAVHPRPEWLAAAWPQGRALALEGHFAAAAAAFAAFRRLDPPPDEPARPTRWPVDVAAALKEGASLSSVMVPDPRLPSNAPEYLESYAFEQMVVSERCFWALPPPIWFEPPEGRFSAFAYCGDSRLFLRYTTAQGARPGSKLDLFYYPGDAYQRFAFVVRHDHVPVYDSRTPADTAALEAALGEGRRLRLVMEANDGLVHVLPVHLCFLYRQSGAVRVITEACHAPDLCLLPAEALWPFWSSLLDDFAARAGSGEMPEPGRSLTDFRHLTVQSGQGRLVFRRLTLHTPEDGESFALDGTCEHFSCRRFRVYARGRAEETGGGFPPLR